MVRNACIVLLVTSAVVCASGSIRESNLLIPISPHNLQETYITEPDQFIYNQVNRIPPTEFKKRNATSFYLKRRNALLELDMEKLLGSHLYLNDLELEADKVVLCKKTEEYEAALGLSPKIFPPSKNFLEVQQLIEQSENFQIIKKMPKGGTLYTVLTASVPVSFMYELTLQDYIYVRFGNFTEFKFSTSDLGCSWKSLGELRDSNDHIDELIRSSLVLAKPTAANQNSPTFEDVLFSYRSLTSYLPNFIRTFNKALETFYEDNIMYAEIYYDFPDLYDLQGNIYNPPEVLALCKDLLRSFLETHEDFIGVRFIYCPIDSLTSENLAYFRSVTTNLWQADPDFLLGFAVMVRGETEKPYLSLIEEFLKFPKKMKLFLDAGVTSNWGTGADFDVYDAIALDSVCMGAAVTLSKHPAVLDVVRKKGLLIKSGPITSQVLGLTPDLRAHPVTSLVALNHPITIAAVASTAWNATGLSYDFYEAYMAMTPVYCGLRCLKQLALNSLLYSNMLLIEKQRSIELFHQKWSLFIDNIINEVR